MDNRWEFEDSSTLVTAWNVRGEGVKEPFEVSGIPVPIGEYEWSEGNIWFNYNRSAPVNAGVRLVFGGFFGGDILSVRSSLNARYAETFNFSLIWTRNNIDLPAGSVVTTCSARASATTSRRGCSHRASCSTTTAISCGR